MPSNISSNSNNNVKIKPLWLQQRDKLLNNCPRKSKLNQIDLTKNNDLNQKGDGDEISNATSSLEKISITGCFSVGQFNHEYQSTKQETDINYTKKVYDSTTQCSFLQKPQNAVQEFQEIKSFLVQHTKPTPFLIKMLKKFIRTQEVGKYVSRGIQAEITLNFCSVPKLCPNEPLYRNYLDDLYAPIKDVYTVDLIKQDERPMTTPTEKRTKKNNGCNTKRPSLHASIVTVISTVDENANNKKSENKSKVLDTAKYSKISRIPKLVPPGTGNKRLKYNSHEPNSDIKKSVPSRLHTSACSTGKRKQKQEHHDHQNITNTKLSKTPAIELQQQNFEAKQKISKIPIADKDGHRQSKTSQSNSESAITESKASCLEVDECFDAICTWDSSKTIVPANSKQTQNSSNESMQDQNSKPNQFLLNDSLQSKLFREDSALWIAVESPENSDVIISNCSITSLIRPSKLTREQFAAPESKLKKKVDSDIFLNGSVSTPTYNTVVLRSKKEVEKHKFNDKEFDIKFPGNLRSKIAPSEHIFLDDKDEKLHKKEKTIKVESNYNERFFLDNKVTYVLKKDPSSKHNVKRGLKKRKVEGSCEVRPLLNYIDHNEYPVEKLKKYCHPKVSKFASYPRHYEELKRNRNKEKTYVLVKNSSNARLRFLSKFKEPFKIISLEQSSQNSSENLYSLLKKSQLWNSYSYVLVSSNEVIKNKRKSRPLDKDSDVTYTLSDTTIFAKLQKKKSLKKFDNLSHPSTFNLAKPLKKIRSSYPSDSEPEPNALIEKNLNYLYSTKHNKKRIRVKPNKSKDSGYLHLKSDCFSLLNKERSKRSKDKTLTGHKKSQYTTNVRLENWVKNIEKTENTLNKLRNKISNLSTVLREASQRRLSQSIQQQFYKPLMIAGSSSVPRHVSLQQYTCHMTENSEHKQQTSKLPEKQSALLSMCHTAPEAQQRSRCGCRNVPRGAVRCPCSQIQQGARVRNNLTVESKPSHSDKFPCMPSVPLHLLVPHFVV